MENVHTTHSKQKVTSDIKIEEEGAVKTAPLIDDHSSRQTQAEAIIRRNVFWAMGAGVVPIPIADVLAVTAVEVKLLRELSHLYEVKFTENIARKIIGSLVAGLGGVGLGAMIGGSLAKLIPAVGTTIGIVSVPIITGALTHAVGKVTVMHLETGGTLLDFDPAAMRSYFRQEFDNAKETVAKLKADDANKAAKKTA